ncbi:(2Fe-2S) ferredoxin domain-containing protein [Leptospira barantonii]|uniref:(2Fe-2S) ferredoxin domain-containing protein n=1 Tax=Leptospira barantonii TaxID=2023184 RepID=A0A5F2BUE9_9LEPT|nr:(2Fe-2S) ferredoxin domain-containing protein [Leptospira barantonii]TGM09763.1 (2Fe-2S) ferredoxin domain-containing protein [Leptospira barantonii]
MSNFYTKHVFVCENVRAEGERVSCGRSGSIQLLASLKKKMKDLPIEGKIRIQRAGCLDRCELGPVQVSYPEGRWFSLRTEEDVDIFLKYYIQSEQIEKIEHLIIKENQ